MRQDYMRHGQNNRGQRNRGKNKSQNLAHRTFDSNGPDIKIRGTAAHICKKYQTLARDAQSSGDRIRAENYLQHADHYYRLIMAAQAQQAQQAPQVQQAQQAPQAQQELPPSQEQQKPLASADASGDAASYVNGVTDGASDKNH